MYDLFTMTLERIQILYVNPGTLLHGGRVGLLYRPSWSTSVVDYRL